MSLIFFFSVRKVIYLLKKYVSNFTRGTQKCISYKNNIKNVLNTDERKKNDNVEVAEAQKHCQCTKQKPTKQTTVLFIFFIFF